MFPLIEVPSEETPNRCYEPPSFHNYIRSIHILDYQEKPDRTNHTDEEEDDSEVLAGHGIFVATSPQVRIKFILWEVGQVVILDETVPNPVPVHSPYVQVQV